MLSSVALAKNAFSPWLLLFGFFNSAETGQAMILVTNNGVQVVWSMEQLDADTSDHFGISLHYWEKQVHLRWLQEMLRFLWHLCFKTRFESRQSLAPTPLSTQFNGSAAIRTVARATAPLQNLTTSLEP